MSGDGQKINGPKLDPGVPITTGGDQLVPADEDIEVFPTDDPDADPETEQAAGLNGLPDGDEPAGLAGLPGGAAAPAEDPGAEQVQQPDQGVDAATFYGQDAENTVTPIQDTYQNQHEYGNLAFGTNDGNFYAYSAEHDGIAVFSTHSHAGNSEIGSAHGSVTVGNLTYKDEPLAPATTDAELVNIEGYPVNLRPGDTAYVNENGVVRAIRRTQVKNQFGLRPDVQSGGTAQVDYNIDKVPGWLGDNLNDSNDTRNVEIKESPDGRITLEGITIDPWIDPNNIGNPDGERRGNSEFILNGQSYTIDNLARIEGDPGGANGTFTATSTDGVVMQFYTYPNGYDYDANGFRSVAPNQLDGMVSDARFGFQNFFKQSDLKPTGHFNYTDNIYTSPNTPQNPYTGDQDNIYDNGGGHDPGAKRGNPFNQYMRPYDSWTPPQ